MRATPRSRWAIETAVHSSSQHRRNQQPSISPNKGSHEFNLRSPLVKRSKMANSNFLDVSSPPPFSATEHTLGHSLSGTPCTLIRGLCSLDLGRRSSVRCWRKDCLWSRDRLCSKGAPAPGPSFPKWVSINLVLGLTSTTLTGFRITRKLSRLSKRRSMRTRSKTTKRHTSNIKMLLITL